MALLQLQALPGLVLVLLRFQTWKKPLLGESMQLWHSLFLARIRGSKGSQVWQTLKVPEEIAAPQGPTVCIPPSSTVHFSWGFWPTGPRPFGMASRQFVAGNDAWNMCIPQRWGCIWGGVGGANHDDSLYRKSSQHNIPGSGWRRQDAFWGTHDRELGVWGSLFWKNSSLHRDSWVASDMAKVPSQFQALGPFHCAWSPATNKRTDATAKEETKERRWRDMYLVKS